MAEVMTGFPDDEMLRRYLSAMQTTPEDKSEAIKLGLLAAGLQLLGARKGEEFPAFSRAGLLGVGTYRGAMDDARQAKQDALTSRAMAMKLASAEAAAREQSEARNIYSKLPPMSTGPMAGMTSLAPTVDNAKILAANQANGPDMFTVLMRRADQLDAANPNGNEILAARAMKMREEARQWRDKNTGTRMVMSPDGKTPMYIQEKEYGAPSPLAGGYQPPPQIRTIDTGGSVQTIDDLRTQPGTTFPKTLTPEGAVSKDLGYANLQLSRNADARAAAAAQRAAAEGAKPAKPEKPTDPQLAARGFYERMTKSSEVIDKLEGSGYVPGVGAAWTQGMQSLPVVGGGANYATSIVSPEMQPYRQAQRDWVRAKLRKESGAVIGKEEEDDEIRTYFPQLGDRPEVVEQKRKARKTAERAMAIQGRLVEDESNDPLGLR